MLFEPTLPLGATTSMLFEPTLSLGVTTSMLFEPTLSLGAAASMLFEPTRKPIDLAYARQSPDSVSWVLPTTSVGSSVLQKSPPPRL